MAQIESFIQSAWQHLRADRPKQAMDCAKKAHAISPNSPEVAHLLGLLASRDGKPEIALPLLQKAIDTGGKTSHRLRHIAEALLSAGHPEAALVPLNDALKDFGESPDLLGLKSAIEIALEKWDDAAITARNAVNLNPNLLAWDLNISIAQLMQLNLEDGFKNATARPDNLKNGSLCPALMYSRPDTLWLRGEQGIGDSLFFLRYVAPLVKKGWQFHLEVDRKLVPILQPTQLFLSVREKNPCPKNEFSLNLGDLPLMALQLGIKEIPPPLRLIPDARLVQKYKQELEKLGPAPYIAVTWRGGPRGSRHRGGIRVLEKVIDPRLLGSVLANTEATIITIQRMPIAEELLAFHQALGRKSADYSALNNNLNGMLAILSLIDDYLTVSNTNLHLREGLEKPSKVFVNRPFQDWRWQAEGDLSAWYPNSQVYRQNNDKNWSHSLKKVRNYLSEVNFANNTSYDQISPKMNQALSSNRNRLSDSDKHAQLIKEGWDAMPNNIPLAIANASAVLKENPANARALHLLSWAAAQDLKFDLAISLLSQATQLEPNNGNIWRDYIRAHVLIEKPDQALQIGHKCLQNPELWAKGVVYFALGVAHARLGDELSALANYEECFTLLPNHIDAMTAAGMIRMRLGENYARQGFKLNSARSEARDPVNFPIWICPVLKGNLTGLKILIVRSMGLGDELSYLRYLPYLVNAGAEVTYWCGVKLFPLLARLPYSLNLIPDTELMPDPICFDLAFYKNELPVAVEYLGAPEIADPLPLTLDPIKLKHWKKWLKAQGPAPYIGVTWRAGVGGKVNDGFAFTRLSKKVEPKDLADTLYDINATFIALQRNVTKDEINDFEKFLGCNVVDVAGLTDDLDDLLCIQYLLDENIGVSNTNMHLRASLNLGSRVLVSYPSSDWRWGVDGSNSVWFKKSKVYRQSKDNSWESPLNSLREDLVKKYGLANNKNKNVAKKINQTLKFQNKIIWVTAGEIKNGEHGYYSPFASAQERVVSIAKLLESKGWSSIFLNEGVSELMGGWHDKLPVKGDVVVFSKVFTEHSITLMQDAKARGAKVIFDVFNNFDNQPKRALHQQKLMDTADIVVSCPKLKLKWQASSQDIAMYFENINNDLPEDKQQEILEKWLEVLALASNQSTNDSQQSKKTISNHAPELVGPLKNLKPENFKLSKRIVWITAGDILNSNGILYSDLASTRYRVISPIKALDKYNWRSEILNENAAIKEGTWVLSPPKSGDIVIISKVFTKQSVYLAKNAQSNGAKVILDLCDNFLSDAKRGPLQKELVEIADHIITSTQALNEALAQVGKQADAVISDPVEFKRGEIHFSPKKVVKLLWFGHAVNIDTLAQSLPALAKLAQTTPLQLNVVTTLPNGQQDLDKITPNGLKATYTPWSVSATEEAVAKCDIVIIPTLQSDIKNAKSPNRLLEPLQAGKMVVAGHLPSYLPFADSAWVGENLIEGIEWCLANPNEVIARIKQGQADIATHFTQQAIGQQWDALLNSISKQKNINTENSVSQTQSNQTAEKTLSVKQIALLTMQHPSLPSIAVRLIEPLGMLDDYSVKIASGINSQRQLSIDYEALLMRDLIVVQRDFPSAETMPLLKKLKALGKKLVYETDDAFHLIPKHHSKAFHRAKAPAIFEFAKIADAITVSTNKLSHEFKPYGNVTVLPNRLSPELWSNALLNTATQQRAKHSAEDIRIGIVGGADHQLDLALLTDAIKTIAKENTNTHWVAYGDGAVDLLKPLVAENQLSIIKTNLDYPSHPTRLAEMALDIALVPLIDDAFNQCRSNLKFLEFGFLGVPTVFSNVESYCKTVVDGKTGLLVNNTTESWVKAIKTLIDNQKLREKISVNAQKEVQSNWMLNGQNNGWKELLEKLV